MKKWFIMTFVLLGLTACSSDDAGKDSPTPPASTARRTVVVYMSGENNLSGYLDSDINEMKAGMKSVAADENLVLFIDRASTAEKPYIAKVTTDGELETLYTYDSDFHASDPEKMADVLNRAVGLCPATEDYGLVLWGHANGWFIEKDSIAIHRAYGLDTGNNSTGISGIWINIPTMREVLGQKVSVRFKFIFFDCCNMQNVETAYELKDVTDYIIASPAEIPGKGAPYNTIVPCLFNHDDVSMYKGICDNYYAQTDASGGHLPISVVKMKNMDALATATRNILNKVVSHLPKNDIGTGHVYYFGVRQSDGWTTTYPDKYKAKYDAKDIIRWTVAGDDEAAYLQWLSVLEQAVVYSRISTFWQTSYLKTSNKAFADFTVTADNYGGVSMFFPLEKYTGDVNFNEDVKKLAWYHAVGWKDVGW